MVEGKSHDHEENFCEGEKHGKVGLPIIRNIRKRETHTHSILKLLYIA
jgi:hypothetical protein